MIKQEDSTEGALTGNDRFEGYCVDLANMLADSLGFTFEIRQVADNQYGSYIQGTNDSWNGMIGEVMTKVNTRGYLFSQKLSCLGKNAMNARILQGPCIHTVLGRSLQKMHYMQGSCDVFPENQRKMH